MAGAEIYLKTFLLLQGRDIRLNQNFAIHRTWSITRENIDFKKEINANLFQRLSDKTRTQRDFL